MPISDSTPLDKIGITTITANRLATMGVHTLGDLKACSYDALIASNTVGGNSIVAIHDILLKYGEGLTGAPGRTFSRNKAEQDLRKYRDEHGLPSQRANGNQRPLPGGGGMAGGMAARAMRRVQNTAPAYVEIIVQQGYRCRACESLTTVPEGVLPKGIEVAGFRWNDSIQAGKVEPYFICLDCAGHVEILGKLMAELMGAS